MDKEYTKKKVDLMRGIMKNPKLAKNFREAISAPVGSTKRAQAKSVFSIMKKLGGLRRDGMGGPISSMQTNVSPKTPNYSNMMVFPAAPKFKTRVPNNVANTSTPDGKGGVTGYEPSTVQYYTKPPKSTVSAYDRLSNAMGNFGSGVVTKAGKVVSNLPNPFAPKPGITYQGSLSPYGSAAQSTSMVAGDYGKPGVGSYSVPGLSSYNNLKTSVSSANVPSGRSTSMGSVALAKKTSSTNLAAVNIAKILNIDPYASFTQDIIPSIAEAIPINEGYTNGTSTIAIAHNNPGNLKFVGQAGATRGQAASDGGYFAKFATPEAGKQALINDLTIKFNSGKYATINDLMTVYSPDSGAPSNTYIKGQPKTNVVTDAGTKSLGTTGTGTTDKYGAQAAVNAQTGAVAYAMDFANEKFGGGLDQYILNLDAKLKKDFNLVPLETELSNLKAQGVNLIPTLQTYMAGKDQYLSFIDSMIDQSTAQLHSLDIGDPAVAREYKANLDYLYTLKGRQSQRYSNFLNYAIADYNADLTRTQNNYDNVYKQYQEAIGQQGAMAENEYNNLYTRMGSYYMELDGAEMKRENLIAMQIQNNKSAMESLQNGFDQAQYTDKDFFKKKDLYYKDITIDKGISDPETGTIDLTKFGPEGLLGKYNEVIMSEGNTAAATKAISEAFAATLKANENDPIVASKIKEMINQLRQSAKETDINGNFVYNQNDINEINLWADSLSNSIFSTVASSYENYIKVNIKDVEKAAKDLVSKSGGFLGIGANAPGIENKEKWIADHSNLKREFLEDLYTLVSKYAVGEEYSNDPMKFINEILSGQTDEEKAKTLATTLAQI